MVVRQEAFEQRHSDDITRPAGSLEVVRESNCFEIRRRHREDDTIRNDLRAMGQVVEEVEPIRPCAPGQFDDCPRSHELHTA
jgi:hypothetical protein